MVCSGITVPPVNASSSWLSLKESKTSQAKFDLVWKKCGRLGWLLLNSDSRHSLASLIREVQPFELSQCLAQYLAQPRCLVSVQPYQKQGVFVVVVWKVNTQIHIRTILELRELFWPFKSQRELALAPFCAVFNTA